MVKPISHLSRISRLIGLKVVIELNAFVKSSLLYTKVIEINLIIKIK